MQWLAGLSRWLTEKVFEYHAYNVKGRIYSELLRLCHEQDDPDLSVTDRDMASRVGTTRENVTRIYRELKDNGIVSRRPAAIRILDTERLKTLLSESEFGECRGAYVALARHPNFAAHRLSPGREAPRNSRAITAEEAQPLLQTKPKQLRLRANTRPGIHGRSRPHHV
jgi:hypothetical protein